MFLHLWIIVIITCRIQDKESIEDGFTAKTRKSNALPIISEPSHA